MKTIILAGAATYTVLLALLAWATAPAHPVAAVAGFILALTPVVAGLRVAAGIPGGEGLDPVSWPRRAWDAYGASRRGDALAVACDVLGGAVAVAACAGWVSAWQWPWAVAAALCLALVVTRIARTRTRTPGGVS